MPGTMSNPYVGTRAFNEQEQDLFFGRKREARDLLALVLSNRLVLLYASSGAGKSSLINAALRHNLPQEGFQVLPPGRVSNGLANDSLDVDNIFIFNLILSLDKGRHEAASFAQTPLNQYLKESQVELNPTNAPHVLIIDQFEEIFTSNLDQWEKRKDFFKQLQQAMSDDPRLWVILALREDYVAALDPYARIMPGRFQARFYMQFLSEEAARQAIEGPAERGGRPFTAGATNLLLNDLRKIRGQNQGNEAPLGEFIEPMLLQVTCRRLWEKLTAREQEQQIKITQIEPQDVAELVNVESALTDYYRDQVAAIAQQSGQSERVIRDWIGRYLITPDGHRGQVLVETKVGKALNDEAIKGLEEARLIRAERRHEATWYELAHDRLIEPVQMNNDDWGKEKLLPWQRQADLWEKGGQSEGFLLQDKGLQEAQHWANDNPSELIETDANFLKDCWKNQEHIAQERKQARIIRWLASGLAATFIFILILATMYYKSNADREAAKAVTAQIGKVTAEAQRQEALIQLAQENRESQPQLSLLLAVEAMSATEKVDPATKESLRQLLAATGGIPLRGHEFDILALTFSPDGRWLATGSPDQTARLWDINNPLIEPVVLRGHEGPISGVAFSPDGSWLATSSGDQTARLWDVTNVSATPVVLAGHKGPVSVLAFSPDGRWLATGSLDQTARLWHVTNPSAKPVVLAGHEGPVGILAFSPDGYWLATSSLDQTARLWDVTNPAAKPVILPRHEGPVSILAFSPDGYWLATGGPDKTVRLWDVTNPNSTAKPVVLPGHEGPISGLAFSPDGRWLATGSGDQTARLWDVTNVSAKPVVLAGHEGPVSALAFSLDGNWLATVSGDNTVQLWDVTNPNSTAKPVVLRGHEGPISGLAFSPDGRWLATGSQDQTARLWDAAHPLAKVEDKQDIHELIGLACQIIGRNLTQEEWQQFLGDQPYHKTCPNLLEFEEEPKS